MGEYDKYWVIYETEKTRVLKDYVDGKYYLFDKTDSKFITPRNRREYLVIYLVGSLAKAVAIFEKFLDSREKNT